jgi:L-2-hydroxyglutarate oxidase
MSALHERCNQNGIAVRRLNASELGQAEPHIRGLGALLVPSTGIVDYGLVTRTMAGLICDFGGEIRTNTEVMTIEETPSGVVIFCNNDTIRAKHMIACAGIMADRIARLAGLDIDFQMVPFRGEYYKLNDRKKNIVKHLIYPIPDPTLPFLGVHLTRTIDQEVTVGPNAVLAFARSGYHISDVDFADLAEMLGFAGFRRLIRSKLRTGLSEMWSSLSKRRYLSLCRRYCPSLELPDLEPYKAGIRAQAVMADGSLAHDFLIRDTTRSIHVCNAPSPAATSSIPIAKELVRRAAKAFGWPEVPESNGRTPPTTPSSKPLV